MKKKPLNVDILQQNTFIIDIILHDHTFKILLNECFQLKRKVYPNLLHFLALNLRIMGIHLHS